MENNKLNEQELQGIKAMLEAKKRFLATLNLNLKAINEIVPLVESCVKDYELQIKQVDELLNPTVSATEKAEESVKN